MSEPIEPVGPFPPKLYRVFSEEKWPRAFADEGRLRFKPVQHFAALEDELRADPSEGHAHVQVAGDVARVHLDRSGNILRVTSAPGHINFQSEFINPVFIYCFSYPPNDDLRLLKMKFGNFVVRIDDPIQLALDITERMTADHLLRETPVLECHRVVYNKGEKVELERDHFKRARLSFMQKPPWFADEYEYRFVSIDDRGVGDRDLRSEVYDVVIGRRLPYASLIQP